MDQERPHDIITRQNKRGARGQDKQDPDGTDTRTVQTHEKNTSTWRRERHKQNRGETKRGTDMETDERERWKEKRHRCK